MKWHGSHEMKAVWLGVMICVLTGGNITHADFVFGEPINLGAQINSPGTDASPLVTPDGLQLYYGSDREGGLGGLDLWMSTRATTDDEWAEPVNLGEPFNTPDWDAGPSLSADGLDLYFARMVYEGEYPGDLWVAKRASTDEPWGEPTNLGPTVNCMLFCFGPCISPDSLTLFFYSDGSGTADVWMTTRPTPADSWAAPVNLGAPVNNESWDYWPHLTADGLVMLFCSDRDGTEDIWMARRPSVSAAWGAPMKLEPPVSTEAWDTCPCVSTDRRTLYFVSDREGGHGSYDLWQASIDPVVDLDGDGLTDRADIDIMLDNWGTDDSRCDIGPTPFGDGVVDVHDLIVLVESMVANLAEEE
jgi:WD40-like Beta Propeller Repeat